MSDADVVRDKSIAADPINAINVTRISLVSGLPDKLVKACTGIRSFGSEIKPPAKISGTRIVSVADPSPQSTTS